MRWKHLLELVGLATALAALIGTFGIFLNVFFHGEYYQSSADLFIREPKTIVLILETAFVALSIPIMIYIGIRDIQMLKSLRQDSEKYQTFEKKAGSSFLTAVVIGLTLTLVVGLVIYIDDLQYKSEGLKYEIRSQGKSIEEMNKTIYDLNSTIIQKDTSMVFIEAELGNCSERIINLTVANAKCQTTDDVNINTLKKCIELLKS